MRRMNVLLAVVLVAVMSFADKLPTQAEVDAMVDREMFKFIHHHDWAGAIQHWKSKGVTDEMFAEAYAKIAIRTMNAPQGSSDHYKCLLSLGDGLRVHATEGQLTNIVYVAEHSTNSMVRWTAVNTFHLRKAKTPEYLDFAEHLLADKNLNRKVCSVLFVGLELDYDAMPVEATKSRERIARISREHILNNGKAMDAADLILMKHDSNYAKTPLHRQVIKMMLDPKSSPLSESSEACRKQIQDKFKGMQKELP